MKSRTSVSEYDPLGLATTVSQGAHCGIVAAKAGTILSPPPDALNMTSSGGTGIALTSDEVVMVFAVHLSRVAAWHSFKGAEGAPLRDSAATAGP